jgi:hypothetical protein
MHSACTGDTDSPLIRPERVDQRVGTPWRFRSLRDVRRKLPNGNFEMLWRQGMPIPPEEALRQKQVTFEELMPREQERVLAYRERQGKPSVPR